MRVEDQKQEYQSEGPKVGTQSSVPINQVFLFCVLYERDSTVSHATSMEGSMEVLYYWGMTECTHNIMRRAALAHHN